MKFNCDCCGACCRNIRLSTFYSEELDRGDGVCKYLRNNLCTIYDKRPIFCNVDAYYEKFLTDKMTREEFYGMNYIFCDELKKFDIQS